jgi:methionyl-tRNA formyltransferase
MAEELGLPITTASNGKELDAIFNNGKPFKSRCAVLIDFGIIVSQNVIDYFPLGIINSHFSILPEWRGADPITFAVLSGQKMTGVSLMYLVAAMDEGPLLGYGEQPITPETTTPTLTHQLIMLSDALLQHDLPRVFASETKGGAPQDITGREVSYSRRLTKEDGILDWHKPAAVLEREIRAFAGWPQSRTTLNGLDVIITKAHVIGLSGKPGEHAIIEKQLVIYAGTQALAVDRIKPAGKKEMTGEGFLAGYTQFLS